MTAKEFAARIGGRQYGRELTTNEKQIAKENDLMIVYGASDDLMEISGAVEDEADCFDGGTFYINRNGIISPQDATICNDCPHFKAALKSAMKLTAVWHDDYPCWTYKTDIPYEEFAVYNDDKPDTLYCIGIVFSLEDLPVGSGENAQ